MAAPIGNKFSYNGGRPPKYETPEQFWEAIIEYFETTRQTNGKFRPTIEGLSFHLGFATRKSLLDYSQKDEVFLNMVNRAKSFIKSCYEQQLYGFAWAGASFALRNIGKEDWKDEVTENQIQTINKVEIIEKTRDSE